MKNKILSLMILLFLSSGLYGQAYVSDAISDWLLSEESGKISINIVLSDQLDVDSLHSTFRVLKIPVDKRAHIVLRELKNVVNRTQPGLLLYMSELTKDSRYQYENLKSFMILNMLSIKANHELILKLAERHDILSIDVNSIQLKIEKPTSIKPSLLKSSTGPEPGLIAINSHLMWALGYTGKNRIGMNVDTGINFEHPAISRNYLGNYFPLSQCWFPFNNPIPLDISGHSHGTHTIGTMMGIDPVLHDTIGVAYNASWISTDPIVSDLYYLRTLPEVMSAFEWALNPDGDTSTVWDMPDVINNSWGWVELPDTFQCTSPYTAIMSVCEAAGIALVFSAGNDGDLGAGSVGEPAHKAHDLVNAFAVGSVNGNISSFPISEFSSLGPTVCADTGSLQIKPEVVAPGQDVRSAMGDDEYGLLSGTSMAGPHAAGAILLLKEAFPYLSGEELKLALYYTASDLGAVGEDNTYGNGIIDVYAAYIYLSLSYTPIPPVNNNWDIKISEIVNPNFDFICDSILTPEINILNSGDSVISTITLMYELNKTISFDTAWTGNLLPSEILNFSFPELSVEGGFNSLVFSLLLDSAIVEYDIFNNSKSIEFTIGKEYDLPFIEDFEEINKLMTNTSWFFRNPDNKRTWTIDTLGGLPGSTKGIFMDFYYYEPEDGQIDELISPIINIPDTGSLDLSYNIAYRQRRSWTDDSLKIYVSIDCGVSFPYLIFANGGDSLETFPHNLGYPRFVPSQIEDWRSDTISITQFIGAGKIMLKFVGVNDKGNSIWLDNIEVKSKPTPFGINEQSITEFRIYPNPASDILIIESLSLKQINSNLKILDINGRLVQNKSLHNLKSKLNISALKSGVYFIVISNREKISYHKFIKD